MSPAHILCQGRFSSHMGVDAHEIITLARHIARAAADKGISVRHVMMQSMQLRNLCNA